MSTKTTFKRISLVAVAALGFGVLSVAPSQAAATAVTFTYTNGTALTTTPVVGTAVQLPISVAAAGTFEAATSSLVATVTTKPTNSTLGTESTTVSITTAAAAIATSVITESYTAAVAGTSGAGISFAATASSTTLTAANAAVFSFTPDVAGYYIITFTTGGTGTQAFVANTVGVNVSGAALVQAATGLGKSTGTQINGRPSAVAFFLPSASAATSRYEISATGAGIVGIFALASKADAASATTSTSVTGVTKKNGTDFTAGATYAGAATTTGAIAVASAITDGFIVTTTSAAAASVVISVKSVNITTGELTAVSSATITYAEAVVADVIAASAYTHLVGGTNAVNAVLGQADSVVAGSKVPSTTRIGSVGVALLNAAGASVSDTYTATITGAGVLGLSGAATTVIGRSIVVPFGQNAVIFPDGTSGVGTITITSLAGKILGTKSVSFYGDASVIVLSSNSNAVVGTLAAPVKATVYDSNGYVVAGAQLYSTSADTTVISNSYTKIATTTAADGTVSIPLTGVKLGTAKITVGLATSATDVTTTGATVKSDALTVTVGGSTTEQAGVVVTTDKQVYTPGSYAYVTVKAVDKAGKTLSPRPTATDKYTVFATGGISASLPIETVTGIISAVDFVPAAKAGTATTADPIVAQAGEYVYKIKLPTYSGDLVLSWTTAAASLFPGNIAAGGVAGSVTVSLSDPGSQAAVDAATEATDAANAATDAALAAADAADAATAAAEDASAAVATLAKSVNTALGNLKKQITALTALVNKLLKK